jgi:ATP-dependent protease ClpP protease subunit
MCIHNPAVEWVDVYSSERLTVDEIAKIKGKLTAQESSLLEEQNRILDVYVERTGADRGELQAIMNEDKFIDMDKAKELGFITDTIAPNTASKKPNKYQLTVP